MTQSEDSTLCGLEVIENAGAEAVVTQLETRLGAGRLLLLRPECLTLDRWSHRPFLFRSGPLECHR